MTAPAMPTPTVTYDYHWGFGAGPVGRAVRDDVTPVSITHVAITMFPGTSELPHVRAEGRAMTKAGTQDARYSYSMLAYADDAALLEGHALWYLTHEGRTFT